MTAISSSEISFTDLWFSYDTVTRAGGVPRAPMILRGTTGAFAPGLKTALIGPDGSGKSTLIKVLAGLLSQQRGEIHGITRGPSNRIAADETAHSIGLLFQEGALFDSLSVFDNVAFPLVSGRVPAMTLPMSERRSVHDRVEVILSAVGLSQHSEKLPGQLSGGMRRRVALARALVARPPILFLDDPTAGLDPVASQVIMELIDRQHAEYQPTTVLISHDLRRLLPISDRVIALFDGAVVFSGERAELQETAPANLMGFLACRGGGR
jgi:phospholipid/cholesterol/gamma-HCH transport system ATP-binding protein